MHVLFFKFRFLPLIWPSYSTNIQSHERYFLRPFFNKKKTQGLKCQRKWTIIDWRMVPIIVQKWLFSTLNRYIKKKTTFLAAVRVCIWLQWIRAEYLSMSAMMMFLTLTFWWSSAQERRNGFRVWRWNSSGNTFQNKTMLFLTVDLKAI